MLKLIQKFEKIIANFLLSAISHYQNRISKRSRSVCRFEPTCSCYMYIAIEKYGAYKGFITGIKRLMRCKIPNGGIDYP